MININFYAATGLINASASFLIGIFVFLKNKKDQINLRFFLFCLSAAVWSAGYFCWQIAADENSALLWSRLLMVGAIFIPLTHFHFVLAFLGKKRKIALRVGYGLTLFFLVISFSRYFVTGVSPKMFFPFWPNPGILYGPFLLMFFSYTAYAWHLLVKENRKSTGIKRQQIRYILISSVISFLAGSTNYFLWYNVAIPPFGNAIAVSFVIFISYAILKHHLFDIKVITTELLVSLLGLVLFADLLFSETTSVFVIKSVTFLGFIYLGWSLIRSVLQEIKRREEVEKKDKELQGAYDELKKLDIAKSEFIAMASHQLRTPLALIKGLVSMILEGSYGMPVDEMEKPLKNIFDSNERLIRIVNDLLSISKVELGKLEVNKESIQLEELIEKVFSELKPRAEKKGIYLKWQKPENKLPLIEADPLKINQAIYTVIENAIRYTTEGGAEITVEAANQKIRIKVKDTGEGMDKNESQRIFESFTRGGAGVRLWTQGAGLGLYLAKRYIELHAGKIWAESRGRGSGSTFYVELPIK